MRVAKLTYPTCPTSVAWQRDRPASGSSFPLPAGHSQIPRWGRLWADGSIVGDGSIQPKGRVWLLEHVEVPRHVWRSGGGYRITRAAAYQVRVSEAVVDPSFVQSIDAH